MARPNKIWFRKDVGWWMVTIAGKFHRLAKGKDNWELADRKYHQLKGVEPITHKEEASPDARVADIIENFIAHVKANLSDETLRNVQWYGQAFSEHYGYLPAAELKSKHLDKWMKGKKWGQTTKRNAMRTIYRAFSWAVEQEHLTVNPLLGMRCPGARARQRCMTDDEFRLILRHSSRNFKILLFALHETGCRPKEARTLTWNEVKADRWVLMQHKTVQKTGRPRVVFLTQPMQKLMRVLRRESKSENVFVNTYGEPWTVNAMRLRMTRIKDTTDLPKDVVPYLLRHAFGTKCILNKVDVLTTAHLMGHSSLEMINRVYVHLADQTDHLRSALEQATRRAPAKPSEASPGPSA